jgi:hypothetical protein
MVSLIPCWKRTTRSCDVKRRTVHQKQLSPTTNTNTNNNNNANNQPWEIADTVIQTWCDGATLAIRHFFDNIPCMLAHS